MESHTKRLYFEDAYLREFDSRVTARDLHDGQPAVMLAETCFYPESGGQPADLGTLNGIEVLDVVEKDGEIWHILKHDLEGEEVKGKIDWNTRFDHMQQHAGQHILSQSFYNLVNGETRSFHLGRTTSTLEIGISKISDVDLERVEMEANHWVFRNGEIKSYFVDEKNIAEVPLRRPPKKSGKIRVVEIGEYDFSACGGTHPARAGEIGLIKILKTERIRGNLRFEFACGRRALLDYRIKNQAVVQAAARFSVAESEVPGSIEKLFSEIKTQKKQIKQMAVKMAEFEADKLLKEISGKVIKMRFEDRTSDEIRFLALCVIKNPDRVLIFGLKTQDRAHIILARSDNLSLDLRAVLPEISPMINARGGGRPSLVELAGDGIDCLDEALDLAEVLLKDKI